MTVSSKNHQGKKQEEGRNGGKIEWKLPEVNTRIVPPPLLTSCSFPGDSYLKLLCGTIFTMFSHTFILFLLRKTSVSVKVASVKFLCTLSVYLCLSSRDLFIFLLRVSPCYSYIHIVQILELALSTQLFYFLLSNSQD